MTGLTGSGNNSTDEEQLCDRAGDRASALHGMFSDVTTRRYAVATASTTCVKTWGRPTNCRFRLPSFRSRVALERPDVSSTFFSISTPPQAADGQPERLCRRRACLMPGFLPCLGALSDFSTAPVSFRTSAAPMEARDVVPSNFLFALAVPRHFVSPNTQQWNFTIQRDLGKQWVLELGYVGTHAVHLRETRTNVQANWRPRRTRSRLTAEDGTPFQITESTVANGIARSTLKGVNGYSGMQLFARRCLRALSLLPDDALAPMVERVFPGRLHLLEIHWTLLRAATPR